MSKMFANAVEKHIEKLEGMGGKKDAGKIEKEIKALELALSVTEHKGTVRSLTKQVERLKNRLEGKGHEFVQPMLDLLYKVRGITQKEPYYSRKAGRPPKAKTGKTGKGKGAKKSGNTSEVPF